MKSNKIKASLCNIVLIRLCSLFVLAILFTVNTFVYFRFFKAAAESKIKSAVESTKEPEKVISVAESNLNGENNVAIAPPNNKTNEKKTSSVVLEPKASTSPTSSSSTFSTVAFYADSQSDTDGEDLNHQRTVNYILNTSASTVFHAGDLLEDGTVASLNRFNAVTSTLRATKAFYSAQGNNERNSSVYFNNFNYPGNEHWFSVNVGNLHMIVLDNYASSVVPGSAQYNWLLSDLQSNASGSRITGVIFHYPVYGAGGDTKGMIGTMVPLFKSYGVDFVISGHEHAYQKRIVDGIHYFVTSGQPSLGYMLAKVYSNRAEFSVLNSGNTKIDTAVVYQR